MRRRVLTGLRYAAMSLLLAAAPAPVKPVQSYDTYKSWFLVCDNTLSCVAKGFSDGNASGVEMKIERDAGPEGKLVAWISAVDKFRLADVKIDGQPLSLPKSAWQIASSDDETSVTSDDFSAVRALIQRLRNGARVTLGSAGDIPLDGFSAAVLRLDARQGRVGGVTALMNAGPASAASVPAPPPLPKIARYPITATLKVGEESRLIAMVRGNQRALFAKEECDVKPIAMDAEAYALDAHRALVLIPCIMGAYQGSSLAFIAARNGSSAQRLIAPTPYLGNDADHAGMGYFTESSFLSKTGELSMAAKGRGMADCGVSASWIWNGDEFRLSEMTLQKSCGGIEPGDWPTLFRSAP